MIHYWPNDTNYNHEKAKAYFQREINEILLLYGGNFELTTAGEVAQRAELGLAPLLEAKLPIIASNSDRELLAHAIKKYSARSASSQDRKDAIVSLGSILEPLRPILKKICKEDESHLFNILNNFDLRHNRPDQKGNYDSVFTAWLFYHFLAAVHAAFHLIERNETQKSLKQSPNLEAV